MNDHANWSDELVVGNHETTAMGFQVYARTKEQLVEARKAVLDRFAELRKQLTGRTMHCGMCESYAKQRDEMRDAIVEWVKWKDQLNESYVKSMARLCDIAEQHKEKNNG